YAVTASHALNGGGGVELPDGLISSSLQAATWTVESSSFAVTAAYAMNGSGEPAPADWETIANKPDGLVSESVQIDYTAISNKPTTIPTASHLQGASSVHLSSYVSAGTNPASDGAIRIPNNQTISARNAANDADVAMMSVGAFNQALIGDPSN